MIREQERWLLKDFFSAYFHQDWELDASTTDAVVAEYVKDHSAERSVALSVAILNYLGSSPNDEELEDRLFFELGCYHLPSLAGLTAGNWLRGIASRLRHAGEPD